jgi:hypothetical protein
MSEAKESQRVVRCRTCGGAGAYTPEYDRAIVAIQNLADAGSIDTLIDDAMAVMKIKHSRRPHVRKLLERFCYMASAFRGT